MGKLPRCTFLHEKLPTMLLADGAWRPPLATAIAVFCSYSAAALEAIFVVSQCSEIFLSIALAFTNTFALYLSALLRLNALLRRTLAGVLFSQVELDRRSGCSARPSSQTHGCSPLCCGGGGEGSVRWLKSALRGVPALCRCSLSVCMTVLELVHVALSVLLTPSSDFRPSVATILLLCGCVRPLLSTLHTVTGYSAKILGVVWDASCS